MNPFLRQPSAHQRTPIRAEQPAPKTADGVAEMRLYDPIDSWGGFWGISAKEFVAALDGLPDDTTEIHLLVNSPGGEVWEGLAILNALRRHKARVVAIVEGIAASSASFIAAGVDELRMMPNSELFVHCAWGLALGNTHDMHKLGDDLAHEDRNLASIYAAKAGGDVDDWLAVMAAERFYSADEAVESGLADKVEQPDSGDTGGATAAKARFDLSVFNRAGRPANTLPPPPVVPEPPTSAAGVDTATESPAAEPEPNNTEKEGTDMSLSEFSSRLGLPDDADETTVFAALDALKARADTPPAPKPDPEQEEAFKVQAKANADLSTKVEMLTEQVQNMGTQLAAANADKAAATKASVLDTAAAKGRFTPADRGTWEARYDKAPDVTTDILASIPDYSAVPMQPVGYTGGESEGDGDSDWDAALARIDGPTTKTGA